MSDELKLAVNLALLGVKSGTMSVATLVTRVNKELGTRYNRRTLPLPHSVKVKDGIVYLKGRAVK